MNVLVADAVKDFVVLCCARTTKKAIGTGLLVNILGISCYTGGAVGVME